MATAFNLTAQLNLRGPNNVNKIVADIKKQLTGITANVNLKLDPNVAKNVKAIDYSLKSLNATLSKTTTNAGSAAAAIAAFGKAVNAISIKNVSPQINAAVASMNKLNKSSSNVSQSLTESATEMQEFGKQAGLAIRRFAAFSAVTGVIYSLSNSITQGIQAYIDYDKELVRLQQVTGETAGGLQLLQDSISQLATGFGVSSKELTTVSVTLAQAGLSAKDTERALRALALSSLAPSFDDMNETVEGSIALMRQFGISAGQLEPALGSINAVAAAFAVEADDLITAIQRTGGVFATASKGVSEGTDALNEFIAVFTSVRATTRESAETIATGLRTIFTRIQRGSTIDALKEFGVTLTDSEGKFVGAYKAVQLLSEGLSKIDTRDIKFSRIVEELGGFRQIGKVIPLIQQFSVAQNALKIAQTGQSSLAKDASTAQLSLANQIQKVREEFFALFREIGQSKGFQSLLTGVLTLTRGLIKLADVSKSLLPALSVVLAFKGASALTQFASGFSKGFRPGGGKPEKERPRFADGGQVRYYAKGGHVAGSGNSDTIPAMLTPGEFVINKKAARAVGSKNLNRINRYASGGKVKDLVNDPNGKKSLKKVYDINKDFDSYEDPTIDRVDLDKTYDQYTQQSKQIWLEANKKYKQDLAQGYKPQKGDVPQLANAYIKRETGGLAQNLGFKELREPQTAKKLNKIRGALAENEVKKRYKLGNPLALQDGADFYDAKNDRFVEIKNQKKQLKDSTLISKTLLAFAARKGNKLNNQPDYVPSLKILAVEAPSPDKYDEFEEKKLGGPINKRVKQAVDFKNLHKINGYAKGGPIAANITDTTTSDGDTLNVNFTPEQKPFNTLSRLENWDAFETDDVQGFKIPEWQRKLGRAAAKVTSEEYNKQDDKALKAFRSSNGAMDNYGRPMFKDDNLGSKLKNLGLAMPYKGKGKAPTKQLSTWGDYRNIFGYAPSQAPGLQGEEISEDKAVKKALGGMIQKFEEGGVAQRKVGYIDYDVIANEANKDIVEKGMKETGSDGPRIYSDYLTKLAVNARKSSSIQKLRAIYGVAGSGKTTLARGQGTDNARLRKTERFPILSPEDIQKATEILILTSSVSQTKMDDFFGDVDRAYTLSSTTDAERSRVRDQRGSRDVTGIGLEGRQPGTTMGVSADTAVGEALLSDKLGAKSTVLGRSGSGRLRRKSGNELVDIVKKRIGFTWGGFAPTTAGHESIMDAAAAMGIPPEDFIALVGANEAVDASSYRTAIFDQDSRVLLAKAGFGAKGATVLPKPRDFEVPQGFDITQQGSDRRQVLIPSQGSTAFVADKTEDQTAKYRQAGYDVKNIERTGGISGTMVRDLIIAGDMAKLQSVLSPGVYDLVSNNIGRIQNRASVLPSLIEQAQKEAQAEMGQVDQQIEALGIKRIDSKKLESDPEYAAKVEVLKELRAKKQKIKSAAGFTPYKLLDALAEKDPQNYALDFSTSSNLGNVPDMRVMGQNSQASIPAGRVAQLAQEKNKSIQDVILEQLGGLGGPAGVKKILGIGSGDRTLSSLLQAGNIKGGKGLDEAADYVNRALAARGIRDAAEAKRLEEYQAKALHFGIAGLLPMDYSKEFEWDIGGTDVYATARGFGSTYLEEAKQMQKESSELAQRFAENVQNKNIFGGGEKLAFDFDKTLVEDADILDAKGKPDIAKYSNREAVQEALKSARPTRLATKLKSLIEQDPPFIKKTRILTARPQSTADLLAQSLQSFGLPYAETDITGVSGGVSSNIPALKAANLQKEEKLIDDSLDNIMAVRKAGKKGFQYTEPKSTTSELDEKMGQGNIEGAIIEKALAVLGAPVRPDAKQNRAIDYPDGLGSASQFFPGIDPGIPTEVKRTIDGSSLEKVREEIGRYITGGAQAVKLARGGAVQSFMAGGAATKTRKTKEPFGTGETEFPTRISKKYAEEQKTADEFAKSKLAWDKYPKDERIMVDDTKVQEAYQQPFDRERFASSFKEKISRDSLFQRMSDFAKFVGLPEEDLSVALPLQLDFGASKRGGGLGMFAAAQFEKGATGIRPYEGYDLSKFGYGEKQKQEAYGLEKLITAKEKEIAKIRKTPTETYDDGSFSFDSEAFQKTSIELDSLKNRLFKLKDLKRDAEKAALSEQNTTSSAAGRGTISFASSMGYSSDTKNSTLYHEMTHQLFQGLRTKSAGSFDKYRDRVSSLFSGDNDDLADAFDSLTAGGGYSSADVVYGRSYKSNNLSQILSSYYRQNLDFSRSAATIPQDTTKNLASLSTQSTAAKRAREYRPINPRVNEALLQAGDKFGMTQEKIDRMEDNGKEEFLTTLMEKAPQLDQNLQGILDSTLTELLSGAGIQRQKYAAGRKVDYESGVGVSPFGGSISKRLSESVYNLQKGTGLSDPEFNEIKKTADTYGYNEEEFKEYLAKRIQEKKNKQGLRASPSALAQQLMQQKTVSTPKQLALAETLKGEPDAGYRPIPTAAERIASDRMAVQNATRRFASGGTVSALVSNGEAYVPPKIAKRIGYGNLNRMNQADRNGMSKFSSGGISVFKGPGTGTSDSIPANLPVGSFIIREKATKALGLNKGGAVPAQRFATGGSVTSMIMEWLSSDMTAGTKPKMPQRPDIVSRATVTASSDTTKELDNLVKSLNAVGFSAKESADILNRGGQVSYKTIEKALVKDIERLKKSTAGIDQITQAETTLARIRNQTKKDVGSKQKMEEAFRGSGRSSGSVQQEIYSTAMSMGEQNIEAKEAARRKKIPQIEKRERKKLIESKREDFIEKEYKNQVAKEQKTKGRKLTSTEKDKVRSDAELKGNTKTFKLTTEEKTNVKATAQAKTTLSAEERTKEYNKAALRATTSVTGASKSELAAKNVKGSDILRYAQESMRDRKTLAEMDKQFVAMAMDEYKNRGTVNGIVVKSAAEAKKAAEEEISKRREAINARASQNGEKGVGAAGLRDYRNSPILNQIKGFIKSPGRVMGGVSVAAGLAAGSSDMIAKNMYDMSTTEGQGKAAKTSAAIQSSGTILSTGLAAASQMATIPVIGPYVAALTAVGTAAAAAADYFYDFTGAQKAATVEFERSVRAKEIGIAMDGLDRAFQNFEKDMGNIDLQNALEKSLGGASSLQIKDNMAERDNAKAEFSLKNRSWSDIFSGNFKGSAKMDALQQGAMDSEMSQKITPIADKAMSLYEKQISSGKSIQDIVNNVRTGNKEAGAAGFAVAASVNPKLWSELEAKIAKSGDTSEQNREKIQKEIAARELLTNVQLQSIERMAKLNKEMDAADRAGRRLAETFEHIGETIDQSIQRMQRESQIRQAQANDRVEARRGNAGFDERAVNNRNVGVLTSPKAYQNDPGRIEEAIRAGTTGMSPELAQKMAGGARLEATLPNVMRNAVSSELKTNANLDLAEAADAARKKGTEAIQRSGLSEADQKVAIDKLNTKLNSEQEKAQKEGGDSPRQKVDFFIDSVSELGPEIANIFGNAGKRLDDIIQARQGIYDTFAKNLQAASEAAKKAREFFSKARDIRYNAGMDLREAQTGVGESYAEAKAKSDSSIARLTGGVTDPQAIGRNIDALTARRDQQMKARDAAASDPNLTPKQQEDAAIKFAKDIQATNNALNDNREALDKLANSAEVAQKALDEVKNIRGLQQDRENFVNQLLTNTPAEADKLNQSFIRLQRNLSGGLNNASNQRDARNAFNDTLRRTGNLREATRAGNTVLADQRKQTLQLMQDPGFRGMMTLNMKNQGMNDQQIDKKFRDQESMLMQQMAVESGMINNPMVRQALAAKQDPNADPAMKRAAEQFLQSTGLQAKATEEQGRLELANVQSLLITSTDDLRTSIDALTTSINASLGPDGERVPGAVGPMVPVPAGARGAGPIGRPIRRATGGKVNTQYASTGKLIDFSPKGTDTVPAMLTPGEFVVNAKATADNYPLLKAINNGTNLVGNTAMMSKGGVVYLDNGGLIDEFRRIDSNSSNFLEVGEIDLKMMQLLDTDKDNKVSFREYSARAKSGGSGSSRSGQRSPVNSSFKADNLSFKAYSNAREEKYSKRYEGTRDRFPRETEKFSSGGLVTPYYLQDGTEKPLSKRPFMVKMEKPEDPLEAAERRRARALKASHPEITRVRQPSLVPGDPRALRHKESFYRLDVNSDGVLDAKEGRPHPELDRDLDRRITLEEWDGIDPGEFDPDDSSHVLRDSKGNPLTPGLMGSPFEKRHRSLMASVAMDEEKLAKGEPLVDSNGKPIDLASKRKELAIFNAQSGLYNTSQSLIARQKNIDDSLTKRLTGGGSLRNPDSSYAVTREFNKIRDRRSAFEEERRGQRAKDENATDEEIFDRTVEAYGQGDSDYWRSMGVTEAPNSYDESNTLNFIRSGDRLASRGDPYGDKARAYIDGYIASQGARQQQDRVDIGMGRPTISPDKAVVGTQGPVDDLNYLIDRNEVGRAVKYKAEQAKTEEENKQRDDAQVKQAEKQASLEKRDKELGIDTSGINRDIYESGGGFSNQPGSGRKVTVEEQTQRKRERAIADRFSFTDKTGKYSTAGTIDKVDFEKGTVKIAKMDPKTGEPITRTVPVFAGGETEEAIKASGRDPRRFKVGEKEEQVYTTVPLDKLSDKSRDKVRSYGLEKEADKAKTGENFTVGTSFEDYKGKIFRVDEKSEKVIVQKEDGKLVSVPMGIIDPETKNIALDQAKTATTVTDLTQKQMDADIGNIDFTSSLPEPQVPLIEDFTDRANEVRQETMNNAALEQTKMDQLPVMSEPVPTSGTIDPLTGKVVGNNVSMDLNPDGTRTPEQLNILNQQATRDADRRNSNARYEELRARSKAESSYDRSWFGENWPKEWGGVSKPEKRLTRKELEELGAMESERGVPALSRLGANTRVEQTRRNAGLDEAQIESLSQQKTEQFKAELEKKNDAEGGVAVGLAAQRAVVPLLAGATAVAAAPALVPAGVIGAGLTIAGGVGFSLGANKLQDVALEGTDFDKRQKELAEKRPGATAVGSLLPGLLTGNPLTGATTLRQALATRAASGATEAALGAGIRGATSGGDFGTVQDVGMDFISGAILPSPNFGGKGSKNYNIPEGPAKPKTEAVALKELAKTVKAEQRAITEENVLDGAEILATKRKQEEVRRAAQEKQRVRDEAEAVKESGREKAVFDVFTIGGRLSDDNIASALKSAKEKTVTGTKLLTGKVTGKPRGDLIEQNPTLASRLGVSTPGLDAVKNGQNITAKDLVAKLKDEGFSEEYAKKVSRERTLKMVSDLATERSKRKDESIQQVASEYKDAVTGVEDPNKRAKIKAKFQTRLQKELSSIVSDTNDRAEAFDSGMTVQELKKQRAAEAQAKDKAESDKLIQEFDSTLGSSKPITIDNPPIGEPLDLGVDPLAPITSARDNAATTAASTKPISTEEQSPVGETTIPQPNKDAADTVTAGTKPVDAATVAAKNQTVVKAAEQENTSSLQTSAIPQPKPYNPTDYPIMDSIMRGGKNGHYGPMGTTNITGKQNIHGISGWKTRLIPKDDASAAKIKEFLDTHPDIGSYKLALNEGPVPVFSVYFKKGTKDEALSFAQASEKGLKDSLDPRLYQGADTLLEGTNISARFDARDLKNKSASSIIDRQLENSPFSRGFLKAEELNLQILPSNTAPGSTASRAMPNITAGTRGVPDTGYVDWLKTKKFLAKDPKKIASLDAEIQRATNVADDWLKENMSDIYSASAERTARESTGPQQQAVVETATRDATSRPTKSGFVRDKSLPINEVDDLASAGFGVISPDQEVESVIRGARENFLGSLTKPAALLQPETYQKYADQLLELEKSGKIKITKGASFGTSGQPSIFVGKPENVDILAKAFESETARTRETRGSTSNEFKETVGKALGYSKDSIALHILEKDWDKAGLDIDTIQDRLQVSRGAAARYMVSEINKAKEQASVEQGVKESINPPIKDPITGDEFELGPGDDFQLGGLGEDPLAPAPIIKPENVLPEARAESEARRAETATSRTKSSIVDEDEFVLGDMEDDSTVVAVEPDDGSNFFGEAFAAAAQEARAIEATRAQIETNDKFVVDQPDMMTASELDPITRASSRRVWGSDKAFENMPKPKISREKVKALDTGEPDEMTASELTPLQRAVINKSFGLDSDKGFELREQLIAQKREADILPEDFFPNGSSRTETPLSSARTEAEAKNPGTVFEGQLEAALTDASSPEALKASAEAQQRLAAQKLAAKSPEQISVEKTYGPLYREAKKANDTAEMARIRLEANAEFKKRSQEASTRSEDKKNNFLPVMGRVLKIAAPIGSAIGYGLGSLLSGSMGRKKEEPQDLASRLENASDLQEVFDLLKLAEKDKIGNPTNPLREIGGSSPLIAKLQKLAPEIYGKKGSDYFSSQDLAAMPEDAYNENFLERLKDNATFEKMKREQKVAEPARLKSDEAARATTRDLITQWSQDFAMAGNDVRTPPGSDPKKARNPLKAMSREMAERAQERRSGFPTDDQGNDLQIGTMIPAPISVLDRTKNDAAAMREIDEKDNNAAPMLEVKKPVKKSLGGLIYASKGTLVNYQPRGTDTVPAMLTPGEFVVNARATADNYPLLKAINSGTNVDTTANMSKGGVVYAQEGALVPSFGMHIPSLDPDKNTKLTLLPESSLDQANTKEAFREYGNARPSYQSRPQLPKPTVQSGSFKEGVHDRNSVIKDSEYSRSLKRMGIPHVSQSGGSKTYLDQNGREISANEFKLLPETSFNHPEYAVMRSRAAFAAGAAKSVVPQMGATSGAIAGAAAGAVLGPPGVIAGGLIGGLTGGIMGSALQETALDIANPEANAIANQLMDQNPVSAMAGSAAGDIATGGLLSLALPSIPTPTRAGDSMVGPGGLTPKQIKHAEKGLNRPISEAITPFTGMKGFGGRYVDGPISVDQLVYKSRDNLAESIHYSGADPKTFDSLTTRLTEPVPGALGDYYQGLSRISPKAPPEHIIGTIAHEAGHHYQTMKDPTGRFVKTWMSDNRDQASDWILKRTSSPQYLETATPRNQVNYGVNDMLSGDFYKQRQMEQLRKEFGEDGFKTLLEDSLAHTLGAGKKGIAGDVNSALRFESQNYIRGRTGGRYGEAGLAFGGEDLSRIDPDIMAKVGVRAPQTLTGHDRVLDAMTRYGQDKGFAFPNFVDNAEVSGRQEFLTSMFQDLGGADKEARGLSQGLVKFIETKGGEGVKMTPPPLPPSPPPLPVNRYANGGMVNMSEGNKIPSEVWAIGTKYTNVMSPEDFEKRKVIRPKLSDDSTYDTPKVFKDYHEAHKKPISIDPALLDKQSSFSKYLQSGGRRMSNNVEIAPKLTTDEVLQYFQNIKAKERREGSPPAGGRVQYATGGIVYANNGALIAAQPMGTDTVPAMLTPGEFVVKKEQAQKHAPILHAINSGAYSRGGIVNYLANGGIVNPNYLSYGGYAKMGEQDRRDPLKEMSQRVAEYNAAAAPQPVPLPAPAPVQVPSPAPVGGVSNNIGIDLAGLQSIVANFQKTVNDFGASVPSLSQVAESMNTGFSSFVTGGSQIGEMLNSATAGLQQVNLPDRIRLEGSVSNNVNINGAEAAARVMDTMGGAIQQGANEQIGRFAGAINRGIGNLGEGALGPDTGQIMGQIGGSNYA